MRETDDLHGLVDVLCGHVMVAAMSGDLAAAEARAEDFLALADPIGERWMRSYVLWALGVAAWRTGDRRRAAAFELDSMRMRLPFDDRLGSVVNVEVLAWITAAEGDGQTAAILLGAARQAADALGTAVQSFALLTEEHERCETQLKAELGAAAFETALRRGSELRAEQVLELASGAKGVPPAPGPPAAGPARSPLTRREQEIAELVAQGLSNKEIAAQLVIAPRTAEGHVEHILVKLGFTSRSQIAAWVAGRRRSPT